MTPIKEMETVTGMLLEVLEILGALSAAVQALDVAYRRIATGFRKRSRPTGAAVKGRDVTIALTGVSARCEVGTLSPSIEVALK